MMMEREVPEVGSCGKKQLVYIVKAILHPIDVDLCEVTLCLTDNYSEWTRSVKKIKINRHTYPICVLLPLPKTNVLSLVNSCHFSFCAAKMDGLLKGSSCTRFISRCHPTPPPTWEMAAAFQVTECCHSNLHLAR